MPTHDREQEQGAAQAPTASSATSVSASAVPMRELLASCAAADAVSKPPSGDEAEAEPEAGKRSGGKPFRCGGDAPAPARDAA